MIAPYDPSIQCDAVLENLRILRRTEVQKIVGLGRSQIYLMMSQGKFPKPVRLTDRAVGWHAYQIAEWLEDLAATVAMEEDAE